MRASPLALLSLLISTACSSGADSPFVEPTADAGLDAQGDVGLETSVADSGIEASADGARDSVRDGEEASAADASDVGDGAPTADSVSVPLDVVLRNSGGGKGLVINVGIGGSSGQPLLVDTGSAGVHILSSAIDASSITRLGKTIKEVYVDGTELIGEEATAIVHLGGAVTASVISIHVIDTIDCVSSKPSCPGKVGLDFFRARGQQGIIGLGMSNSVATPSVFSPIAQMGGNLASGFIVHARPFGSTAGTLTIGLTTANTAGFSTTTLKPQSSPLPNGAAAWQDAKVDVCYALDGVSYGCGPSIFDTGATATFWNQSVPSAKLTSGALSPGSVFKASIAGVLDWSFTVGGKALPGLDMVIPSPGSFNTNLGIGVFFAFDVAFDLKKGTIGVR